GSLLRLWCQAAYPALPAAPLPYSKKFACESVAIDFVQTLAHLDFLDAAYWLSSSYAMLLAEAKRKRLAMFFTPVSLTRGLLDDLAKQGVNFSTETFMDPACGGAAFLAPIAMRMKQALAAKGKSARQILRHVETHIRGADLDRTLCELSRQFLCMALHREIEVTGYVPSFKVNRADSLTGLRQSYSKIDVVVCNPPYRKMTTHELTRLHRPYSEMLSGQPNLYGLFIALCVRLVRKDGVAALVTPTSFLSGQHFGPLRTFLMRHTDVAHIGMVSDRQGVFIDVEQETALTVLRRRAPRALPQLNACISVVSATGQYQNVGEYRLPNSGSVWPVPRSVEDVDLLERASLSPFRLADYGYRVRIGAFVWNRDERPTYASRNQVRKAKAVTAVPLLWSSDIA